MAPATNFLTDTLSGIKAYNSVSMKFCTSILTALLAVQADGLAFSNANHGKTASVSVDRRSVFAGFAAVSVPLLLSTPPAMAAPIGAEAFVGTFTDPINHPGGTRTIKLLDGAKVGDYQLAEVTGGGGRGEPANYVLPAAVIGGRTIVIDFSPKGGPRDFVGVLDGGDIKFLKDGNRWPRQ